MYVDNLENIAYVKPVIICGNARSGTRMMTDIANTHPHVAVQEEMHAKTIEAYFEFTRTIDENFSSYSERKGHYLADHWDAHKKSLTLAFLSFANKKEMIGQGKSINYYGIKTPGFERYFSEFETLFNSEALYIYCVRNPVSVWRSWKSMGYLNDIEVFKNRYSRSIRQAIKIKRQAEDRLAVFNLDEFISAKDKGEYVSQNIFEKLALEGLFDKTKISSLDNRNSMQNRGVKPREEESFLSEKEYLEKDESIRKFRDILLNND